MTATTTFWIIIVGAVFTYLTRIGGHLVLSRFDRVHPRVEAGLNAVPAAVLTSLVAPAAMEGGPAEIAALATGAVVSFLGGGMMTIFFSGGAVLIALRHFLS
ncbi:MULTISPECIES: AzlD domain-containing protein [Chelativorans]|uniref:Branched-chain amino acid transport n=1 Tax=Chelativorans sp. (strain BNC1) TaxID=266779 RepID=Q11GT7_CHESB